MPEWLVGLAVLRAFVAWMLLLEFSHVLGTFVLGVGAGAFLMGMRQD